MEFSFGLQVALVRELFHGADAGIFDFLEHGGPVGIVVTGDLVLEPVKQAA